MILKLFSNQVRPLLSSSNLIRGSISIVILKWVVESSSTKTRKGYFNKIFVTLNSSLLKEYFSMKV